MLDRGISGSAGGLGIWCVGVVTQTPYLQLAGLVVGIGMLFVGLSKEIRSWLDRGNKS